LSNPYLVQVNKKETNPLLVSFRVFAEENDVPIITYEGLQFLIQVIQLRGIKNVLEIGTAIGYSSIALVLKTGVKVTTIERKDEMVQLARENFAKAGVEDKITLIHQDALEVDETTLGEFDLIFIDAAKSQSIKFFEKYETLLTDKGVIVTDNLLFHDLFNQEVRDRNLRQLLRKIDTFNKYVVEKEGYNTYIYTLGDGMSLSIKE
jgi:predicted O-methyltransferase YrrM